MNKYYAILAVSQMP